MRFDRVITLVAEVADAHDAIGQQVVRRSSRDTFANEFTLNASEFYEAAGQGLRPERRYQIRAIEYEGEEVVIADGIEFTVIRADNRGEWAVLTLERKGRDRG